MLQEVEEFLSYLRVEKAYSDNTLAAYRNDLTQFVDFIRGKVPTPADWNAVDKNLVVNYVMHLKEREYASSSVARKLAAVKSFFHFLAREGRIKEDPTTTLDSPRLGKRLPKTLTRKEVDRLLEAPGTGDDPKILRDRAILELLYATGMRVTELVSLTLNDINLASGSVRVVHGKRHKERIIPVHPHALEAVEAYLQRGRIHMAKDPNEQALFVNFQGKPLTRQGLWLIIKHYVEEAGISKAVTPHTLRHSFATHLLTGGAKLPDVQRLLGHASVSTTQIYTHLTKEELREAYDNAHPRARKD
ncbi:MAG: site-specific tyrosine recombinase XerD [Chloroflexi bacterium]|nr:site-specific tyrosine recombinase XerD [Chloroflexota bacterium]